METQLSFMELYDLFVAVPPAKPKRNTRSVKKKQPQKAKELVLDEFTKECLDNSEEYLFRGNRLISIAKEAYEKKLLYYSVTDIEKKLASLELNGDIEMAVDLIAKKVVLPFLKAIQTAEDASNCPLLSCFDESLSVKFTFPLKAGDVFGGGCVPEGGYRFSKKEPALIGVTVSEYGTDIFHTIGLKNVRMPKRYHNAVYTKNPLSLCDISTLLAYLIVISYAHKELTSMKDIFSSEFATYLKVKPFDVFYHPMVGKSDEDKACFYTKKWYLNPLNVVEKEYRSFFDLLLESIRATRGVEIEVLENVMSNRQIKATYAEMEDIEDRNTVPVFFDYHHLNCLAPLHFLEFYDYATKKFGKPYRVSFRSFLKTARAGVYYPMPTENSAYRRCLFHIFFYWQERKKEMVSAARYLAELKGEYTRSYETLKTHSKKMLAEMQTSPLNEYFGFVELDEDVDLEKYKEIMKQFIAWKNHMVPFVDAKDNAIRFRKLGNHHASGLYYPFIRCMCVDYRTCTSFVHEFGHLMDHMYDDLSSKTDFYAVKTLYKERLEKVAETTTFKGKYNLSYYCMPTEIFARSFELYNAKVKGIHNSLLPIEYSSVYPQDEEFLSAVSIYFDSLFESLSKKKED